MGAGWGNGRAVAVLFALAGAKVFAVDRDLGAMEETLGRIREAGGEVTPYACDVTDSSAVAAMVEACKQAYGTVDILVNNVGGSAGGAVACQRTSSTPRSLLRICAKFDLQTFPSRLRRDKAGVIQLGRVTAVEYAPKVFA